MPTFLSNHKWLRDVIAITLAILTFALILLNRSPNLLRPVSIQVLFGFVRVIPIVFILLFLIGRIPGWLGQLLSVTAVVALFALALAGMWASGHTRTTVLSGLIPLFDAQYYYIDALRILAGKTISEFSTARPIFPGFLSLLLAITNKNLMGAIAILTAINGLTCYFAIKEIQRTHGNLPAVFLGILLFLYYRYRTIGTVMSENLGLPLGIIGTLLIWRGLSNKSQRLVLSGLFIETLALNTRPGPFFVLPLLLLWGGWYFRDAGKRISWRFLILGLGVVIAGFGLNLGFVRLLGSPTGVPFSQFSFAFYGLASGGNSWAYIFQIHPEVLDLPNREMTWKVYQLAFELIRTQPILIVQGIFHNMKMFLFDPVYGMFSYVSGENNYINIAAHWGLLILSALGILEWIRKISDPHLSFVAVAMTGVILSAPFVPPTDAYGVRLYAAALIIIGLLPTMGLVFLLEKIKVHPAKLANDTNDLRIMPWFGIGLVLLVVIGPLVVKGSDPTPQLTVTTCQPDETSIITEFSPGSFIQLVGSKEVLLDWMPVFHIGLFTRNAHSLTDLSLTRKFETINPSVTLFYTLDYKSSNKALVIAPTADLPAPGSTIEICGQWEDDPALESYSLFTSRHIQVISK